jgi:hypothetical protein
MNSQNELMFVLAAVMYTGCAKHGPMAPKRVTPDSLLLLTAIVTGLAGFK